MIKVGLSGNRYSGKNRVKSLFKQIGIPVFEADIVLNFILNYNWELLGEVRQELGSEIFKKDLLDFKNIKNPEVFNNILDIVQPDIFRAYERFNDKNSNSIYTIFNSSILFERNWDKNMDKSISVFAPVTDRIKRCKYETNMGLLTINDFTKTEMDPLEKNRLSDYTIHNYNNGELSVFGDILQQVSQVDQKIIDEFLFNEVTKKVI
jgi:dephospho-CoA kinase